MTIGPYPKPQPHSDVGLWRDGYWASVRLASNLSEQHIRKLLRLEDMAIASTKRLLSWYEGRADGLRSELTHREGQRPYVQRQPRKWPAA